MDIQELEVEINSMLAALQLKANKVSIVKDVSVQFIVDDFGTVVCGINRVDYIEVKKVIDAHFDGYRIIYITTNDNMSEKRYEVVWELMTGGYLKWIRFEHPRLFANLINIENFGNKIIVERLRRFNNRAKYKYLIEQNEWARRSSGTYVLSVDPGFYDLMVESGE